MKLLKFLATTLTIVSVVCIVGCNKLDEDVATNLKRDTDEIEIAYASGSTGSIYVRYSGSWSARAECFDSNGNSTSDWFTLSPDSGIGDGVEYQIITVTAERNPGDARTGNVYIRPQNGEEICVAVTQDEGYFSVSDPVISGTIKSGSESAAYVSITYDKAFGGEEYEIEASLSGAGSDGLEINSPVTGTIEREGSGTITLSITGEPTSIGDVVVSIKFTLDGEVVFEGDVSASVVSNNTIFSFGFDLFVWGGDYPNNATGVGPNGQNTTADAGFDGTEDAPYSQTAGTDGTNDVFGTMGEQYRINRGVQDWSGSKVYEHPGYVKLGTSSAGGWIMTPALTAIGSAPTTITVSIDFLRFDNENGTIIVSAEGAGTCTNGTVDSNVLPAQTGSADRKWTTLSFTVVNATNQTQIKISAEDLNSTTSRFNIDNIIVMGNEVAEVTEQLPTPENVVYTPGETSIRFSWDGVAGATSYEASIAVQTSPDFKKTVNTVVSECEFDDLTPGLYVFTLKALYEPNSVYDSEEYSEIVGTAGYTAEKLATPTNIIVSDIGASSATIKWDAVSGAANYRVVVTTTQGGEEAASAIVSTNSYYVTGLTGNTSYTVTVQALIGDGSTENEFDSDTASETFETLDLTPLTAPTVSVPVKTYGLALLEWELTDEMLAEQSVSSADTYDFRLKDAEGNVLRLIENYASYNWNKYPNKRQVFGGLEPSTTYILEMRRKSTANTAVYDDSEWASVTVTTDAEPDKSGYLVYWDFEKAPFGGQAIYGGYGYSTSFSTDVDYSDALNVTLTIPSDKNSIYTQSVSSSCPQSFYDAYLPGLTPDDFTNETLSTVAVAAGYMKFGGSSKPSWITLPAVDVNGSIYLELETCPYTEPSTAGDYLSPSNTDITEYFYINAPECTIESVEGDKASGATISSDKETVTLQNKLCEEIKSDGYSNSYEMTYHKVKISGVTSSTRIKIYTYLATDGNNHRMWIDNVKVSKAD